MIEANNVFKTYQSGEITVEAVKDFSLTIDKGDFVSIVGPSGSGKSTVLNLLGCLDRPTRGSISINGEKVSDLPKTRLAKFRGDHIGFIFQSFNLIPVLSVYENIEYPLLMVQALAPDERKDRVMRLLAEVGMENQKAKLPDQISGGQKQRVAIARALVTHPAIVFADEPTANLDSKTAFSVISLMQKIQQELGTTFLFATHDEKIVSSVNRLITLVDGQITEDQRITR